MAAQLRSPLGQCVTDFYNSNGYYPPDDLRPRDPNAKTPETTPGKVPPAGKTPEGMTQQQPTPPSGPTPESPPPPKDAVANEKAAAITTAYARIRAERGFLTRAD